MKWTRTHTLITAITVLSASVLLLGGFFIYYATSQSYMRKQLDAIEQEKESQRVQQEKVTNAITDLFTGGVADYQDSDLAIAAQRRSDVNTILNALYQYAIDHGSLPTGVPTGTPKEICRTGAISCSGLVDLTVLVDNYLVRMPQDPKEPYSSNATGYSVIKRSDDRIVVTALRASSDNPISIAR